MQYRKIGNSDIDASVVAFGAWAIGGWKWGGTDATAAIAAIDTAIGEGINFIDTAAVYGFGLSEELVGNAIQKHPRDKLVVATKCGLRWDIESKHLHVESEGKRVYRTLTADSIKWEVEESLKRLNTDYIDLYQTHWPDPHTPAPDVIQSLERLKIEGKIRSIGFCNASPDDLQAGVANGQLDVDQERYSLLDRERDSDNLPLCDKHSLSFLAYSPIAQGLLTDKLNTPRTYGDGDLRVGNPRFSKQNIDRITAAVKPIKELAAQRELSVEHVVLAWTLQQPGLSHVLVGARNAAQAKHNALAGSVSLTAEELQLISDAAATWKGFSS